MQPPEVPPPPSPRGAMVRRPPADESPSVLSLPPPAGSSPSRSDFMRRESPQARSPIKEGLVIGRRDRVSSPAIEETKGSPSPPFANTPATSVLQRREQKWANIVHRYQAHEPVTKKELKRLIRKGGIPPAHRGTLWQFMFGSKARSGANLLLYKDLLKKHQNDVSKATVQIDKDLLRTLPPELSSPELIQSLRRVLVAYSWFNPEVGYCQSMNFVVAFLLLCMSEEDAFWMTVLLVEKLAIGYYTRTMLGVIGDARIFAEILSHKLPKLSQHFQRLGIGLEPIIVRWFLCLFANLFSFEAALRFFDFLFLDGSKALFRFGLGLFKFNERGLLQMKEFEDCFRLLNRLPSTMSNPDALVEQAYDPMWKGSVSRSRIQRSREQHHAVLKREKKRFIDEAARENAQLATETRSGRNASLSISASSLGRPANSPSPSSPSSSNPASSSPRGSASTSGEAATPLRYRAPSSAVHNIAPLVIIDEYRNHAPLSALSLSPRGHPQLPQSFSLPPPPPNPPPPVPSPRSSLDAPGTGAVSGSSRSTALRPLAGWLGTDDIVDLADKGINDSHAAELAAELETNTSANTLILDGNDFADEGLRMICRAFIRNTTLTKLLLSRNKIGDNGARHLAQMLLRNPKLRTLSLAECGISDTGLAALLAGLEKNTVLESLTLTGNIHITDATGLRLVAFLKARNSLKYVDVTQTGVSAKVLAEVAALEERTEQRVAEAQARALLDLETARHWLVLPSKKRHYLVLGVNYIGRPEAQAPADAELAREQLRIDFDGTTVDVTRIGENASFLHKHSSSRGTEMIFLEQGKTVRLRNKDKLYLLQHKYEVEFCEGIPHFLAPFS